MRIDSVVDLCGALRDVRLLEPSQLQELPSLRAGYTEPRALARELVQRGWLTPFQVNALFQGREGELLLGSYVLLERLGEGGMGQVFKARNWKLGRIVALKLIRKERLASPGMLRRFQREIRAAAQLAHPNIVHADDADEVAGTHFMVMEYVEGTDLARRVNQAGPLPVELACEVVRQAAQGLQHACEGGLTHRDVKPSNLLLTREGQVKLLDMGLARLDSAEGGDQSTSTLTQEEIVMGTPDFVAPEQALDPHTADIRADLYSLGCTFYFLLTGRLPFPGDSVAEKLLHHQMDEPVPLQRLRPEVPAWVAAVVRRLMAKRPEDRFRTPAELAAALVVGDSLPAPAAGGSAGTDGPTDRAAEAAHMAAAPASAAEALPAPQRPARNKKRRWGKRLAASGSLLAAGVALLVFLLLRAAPRPTQGGPLPAPPTQKPPEEWVALFNGKDLRGWDTWLGTPPGGTGALGLNADPKKVFSVVTTGGQPAIRISGENWGGLITQKEFENYHLRVEFKWGEKQWPKAEKTGRDTGVLYHCVGALGAVFGYWPQDLECQIRERECGDCYLNGGPVVDVEGERPPGQTLVTYAKGGVRFTVSAPIKKSRDYERPNGQWNTIEVLTVGGTCVHLVNGHCVMVVTNARHKVGDREVPLTRGKLMLQSLAAEVFYRNLAIRPLRKLPDKYWKGPNESVPEAGAAFNPLPATGGIAITREKDRRRIRTPKYEAVIEGDGCLTSLRVGDTEFLWSGGKVGRGLYLHHQNQGTQQLSTIEEPAPNVIVARNERGSLRYEFGPATITVSAANASSEPLNFYIVFSQAVIAAANDKGERAKTPAERDWQITTWYAGNAKLTITGGARIWGPWGEEAGQKFQVWDGGLAPKQKRQVVLEVKDSREDEPRK